MDSYKLCTVRTSYERTNYPYYYQQGTFPTRQIHLISSWCQKYLLPLSFVLNCLTYYHTVSVKMEQQKWNGE